MSQPTAHLLARRAIRGGALLLAARFGMQAFTWGVTLAIPALVQSQDYGVMTWGFVFLYLMEILAEAGLGRALVQREDATPEDRNRVFTLSLMLAATAYAILFFSADAIALYVGLPAFATFLRVLGLAIWLVPFRTVAMAILDREQRLGQLAGAHVITAGTQSILVLSLAYSGLGYWALTVGALVGNTLEVLCLWIASGWWPRLAWPGRASLPLLSFGAWTAAGTLVWFVYDNVDFAIVGRLFGLEQLGYYSLAFTLMTLPVQKLAANVNQVAYPVFCRLQTDRPRLANWYLRLTVMLGFLGTPALVGMALIADDAIGLAYKPEWQAAVEPFRLLAFVGVVRLYAATLPPLFSALGLPRINFYYAVACLLVLPPAFWLGGQMLGLRGVCISWLVVYPAIVAALLLLTQRYTGFGLLAFLRPQLPIVAATVVMVLAVLLLRQTMDASLTRLVAAIATGAVTYAGSMLLLGRGVVQEVRQLWSELRRRSSEPEATGTA
jgi:O-antigen/teichoic acid export membrane protein